MLWLCFFVGNWTTTRRGGARRGGVDYEFLRCVSSHIYTSPSRDIFIVTQPAIDLAKLLVWSLLIMIIPPIIKHVKYKPLMIYVKIITPPWIFVRGFPSHVWHRAHLQWPHVSVYLQRGACHWQWNLWDCVPCWVSGLAMVRPVKSGYDCVYLYRYIWYT